ncbi:hypothetical protein DFH06DRAFT_69382 [Mycena polygramma]|nr:hypothetical protein DFH06DRAFT_69382 [Mycena polygramma]
MMIHPFALPCLGTTGGESSPTLHDKATYIGIAFSTFSARTRRRWAAAYVRIRPAAARRQEGASADEAAVLTPSRAPTYHPNDKTSTASLRRCLARASRPALRCARSPLHNPPPQRLPCSAFPTHRRMTSIAVSGWTKAGRRSMEAEAPTRCSCVHRRGVDVDAHSPRRRSYAVGAWVGAMAMVERRPEVHNPPLHLRRGHLPFMQKTAWPPAHARRPM